MIGFLFSILTIVAVVWFAHWRATDYDFCYSQIMKNRQKEYKQCGGMLGGDRSTNYLSEVCISCPYYKEEKLK